MHVYYVVRHSEIPKPISTLCRTVSAEILMPHRNIKQLIDGRQHGYCLTERLPAAGQRILIGTGSNDAEEDEDARALLLLNLIIMTQRQLKLITH